MPLPVLHLSTDLYKGGAGIAAYRLHIALLKAQISSSLFTSNHFENSDVTGIYSDATYRFLLTRILCKLYHYSFEKFLKVNGTLSSFSVLNIPSTPISKLNLEFKFNRKTLHLHWVQHEFINLCPLFHNLSANHFFWTLHDMWPLTGIFHYDPSLFTSKIPKATSSINNLFWKRKLELYSNKNIHFIAPSSWMASKASVSLSHLPHCTVDCLPNALPPAFFQPPDREYHRQLLDLPSTKKILLFSVIGNLFDPRKGISYLVSALDTVLKHYPDLLLVSIGQTAHIPFPFDNTLNLGLVQGDYNLFKLYSAVDCIVVPSLADNLPQVATEAQASGTPVVAFNIGGMSDIILNGSTGFLANNITSGALAESILNALDPLSCLSSHALIQSRANSLWSESIVADQHIKLYNRYHQK